MFTYSDSVVIGSNCQDLTVGPGGQAVQALFLSYHSSQQFHEIGKSTVPILHARKQTATHPAIHLSAQRCKWEKNQDLKLPSLTFRACPLISPYPLSVCRRRAEWFWGQQGISMVTTPFVIMKWGWWVILWDVWVYLPSIVLQPTPQMGQAWLQYLPPGSCLWETHPSPLSAWQQRFLGRGVESSPWPCPQLSSLSTPLPVFWSHVVLWPLSVQLVFPCYSCCYFPPAWHPLWLPTPFTQHIWERRIGETLGLPEVSASQRNVLGREIWILF